MQFITSFLKPIRTHDSIIVIVDRLTKVEDFISVKSTLSISDAAWVLI